MIPGSCVGKYRLVRRLGHGAMGEVWEAENIDTDRAVALKLITSPDPDLRRRLLREARAIGRLEHPNIVQILDRGETETGEPFLVMQLLRGETLADLLRRERRLDEGVAANIALDVARALRVAHEKQIVHRDLKPANIFLHIELDAEQHVVKVVDFGVSKLNIDNEGAATLAGGLVGSPAYMSPEQIRAQGVDGQTDVWALGVLLFEMLTGERPFNAQQSVAVLTKILTQPAPRVETLAPHVSPGLGNVIAACLERDRTKRVASAEELVKLLRPFVPRGRLPTLQDATAIDRFVAIPEPPRSSPKAVNESEDPDGDEATTALFKPSAVLKGVIAAQQAAEAAPRQPPTGTVLMSGRTPGGRETATNVYGKRTPEPPLVDDDRTTSQMIARVPLPAPSRPVVPSPAAPPPPRPAMPSDGRGAPSQPSMPATTGGDASYPPAQPAPSLDFGSGSWEKPPPSSPPASPSPASPYPPVRPREPSAFGAFGGTQPLTPEMIAAARRDPRKTTLKMDPNAPARSPLASAHALPPSDPAPPPAPISVSQMPPPISPPPAPPGPPALQTPLPPPHLPVQFDLALPPPQALPSSPTSSTSPLTGPLLPPPPPFELPEPPPRRGLPLVLLAISALALAIVVTMLVLTLVGDRGAVAPAAGGAASSTADAGSPAPPGAPAEKR